MKVKVGGYIFEVIGEKGKGYEIAYNNVCIGYADTLGEADMVIEQVIGNGVGDCQLREL